MNNTNSPKNQLTKVEANHYFTYDTATGDLYWAESFHPSRMHVPAGTLNKINGYGAIKLTHDGITKCYQTHNLVWNWHNGIIPDGYMMDHKNRIRNDNHIENLRLATSSTNMLNLPIQKNNKSGIKGVYWNKNEKKWVAQIRTYGKVKYLGSFIDKLKAAEVYKEASKAREALYLSDLNNNQQVKP